jgi:hypothetical protein
VTTYHQIGSHTLLDGLRNAIQNGCVGDGTTDDRSALNTLANTTLQSAGGIIYFPSGYTFRISSDLTFPVNVTLWFAQGSTLSVDSGKTVTILGPIMAQQPALFTGSGSVAAALATTATTGFEYVPTCAGVPTGVPVASSGRAPIVIDTTNHRLYFYSGGSWRNAGP